MPEKKTPDRKDQIAQVASEHFHEKGYMAVSMRDLAKEVGIEAASFYNHYESKGSILKEICFRMADEFFSGLNRALSEHHLPAAQLQAIIREHVGVVLKNFSASAVFFREWRHLSEPWLSQFLELRRRYEEQVRQVLSQGMNQGLFRQMDQNVVVYTLFSLLNGLHEWKEVQQRFSPQEVTDHIAGIVLNGIAVGDQAKHHKS
ncbi:MAG: TetR/AcrR family transcriptional regulator [Chitinophagales bacterium]|nr:TetR/AcrR family transcriptional regulator [Chitinophagales bacterium]MDW8393262.1 TetR/AcrR family transcriptional regulator [Chitinophagales bacterium]